MREGETEQREEKEEESAGRRSLHAFIQTPLFVPCPPTQLSPTQGELATLSSDFVSGALFFFYMWYLFTGLAVI